MEKSSECHLITGNPTKHDLSPIRTHFDIVETYEEETHLFRRLIKCKKCGQLYFYEFFEQVDWRNGDDPQYCTFIPVNSIQEARNLNKLSTLALLSVSPQLRKDFTDRINIYWVR